ncbi:MAG: hypothetical protein JW910_17095 [Anaerolineae bacterium]|nr:hypothetical protein [Anaerolineae bacterium]
MQTIPTNPDHHFLLFAPGLEAWVFAAARRYWDAYRPILYSMRTTDDVALLEYASGTGRTDSRQGGGTVAVTLVMRRDTAAAVRAAVAERLPDVYLDPLVYDVATDLQITLNARVEFNQRFGVPEGEDTPRPTPTFGPVISP